MDVQHQGLIDLMNRVYDRNAAGASNAELLQAVDQLGGAVVDHFAAEERFMESIAYEGIVTHRHTHKSLLTQFGQYRQELADAGGSCSPKFFAFLKMWLASHICGIDAKYGAVATAGSQRLSA